MIHYVESISQCIRAASHSKIRLNVIAGPICLTQRHVSVTCSPYSYSPLFHICPQGGGAGKKILNSVKGPLQVSRERRLSLTHMTAVVSFTLCCADRCGNGGSVRKHGPSCELRRAINISGNNNQRCLFSENRAKV